MDKDFNVVVEMDDSLKQEAEGILNDLGISPSEAISMFYLEIVRRGGLPFNLMDGLSRVDVSRMDEATLYEAIMKGYEDIEAGRCKPAKEVFESIRKGYKKA